MSEVIDNSENEQKSRRISESSDSEFDPQFKPIVNLPVVKVSTNEENEEQILKIRAKLYRFDGQEDPPEWKERGTGDVKILRHKENNSVRVVMRRDKTLKVCANHFITPWMELLPSIGNEKAFVYTVAADFADELAKRECLAIRFGTIENANLFKEKFNEAKRIVATECKLYNGKGDDEDSEPSEEEEADDSNDEDSGIDKQGEVDNDAVEKTADKLSELNVNKEVCEISSEKSK